MDWYAFFAVAADVAIVVMALAVTLVSLVTLRAVQQARAQIRQQMGPVSDRARAISDNVEFITQALRTDVERLNASVKALSGRLQQASDRMEERIEEFNALMEVVQDEAEEIFLDTAATVRGVREGARSIASPRRRLPKQDDPMPPPAAPSTMPETAASEGDA